MLVPHLPNPAGSQARVVALSSARLRNYRSFFRASSDAEVLGLYQWNEDLSGLLYRAITELEIVMRNGFHRALSQRYGANRGTSSSDWYEYLRLGTRSRQGVEKVTHHKHAGQWVPRRLVPSPDDVVSQLSFGFWTHLLDVERDIYNVAVPWETILVDALPGFRQQHASYWATLKHRDALFARIELCNELRNRIAHHEPVWKLKPLMEERRVRPTYQPRQLARAPTTSGDALGRLRLIYNRIIELLGWLSPSIAASFTGSMVHRRCLTLLEPKVLDSYRQGQVMTLDLSQEPNLDAYCSALRLAAQGGYRVLIQDGGDVLGEFFGVLP